MSHDPAAVIHTELLQPCPQHQCQPGFASCQAAEFISLEAGFPAWPELVLGNLR